MPKDTKVTPITRHEPRTFYATRAARTQGGECWDLWAVQDGRRVGFLTVVDDGKTVNALALVKAGTPHDEVVDLVDGFFTASSTTAQHHQVVVSDFEKDPTMVEL